ncbi:hypothetical protein CCH79_00008071, partial [Gambusia affinis]
MPRGSEIPEGIRSTAVDLHKAGKGYKFISKTLEIPPSTVRSIIVKWKRFNTVATLPRSGRPSKGNPRRKRKEKLDEGHASRERDSVRNIVIKWKRFNTVATLSRKRKYEERTNCEMLDEADPAGPASEKGGDPDKPDLLSKVLFAAGNTDSNSTESKPSKEELASSRPTLHSRDKEMRDLNSSCEEGDNTGRSDSDEEDPMSSFLFARSTGEAEDHERVDHPGRVCDTEDPDESQKDESTVEEDGDAEPSDTDEEDPLIYRDDRIELIVRPVIFLEEQEKGQKNIHNMKRYGHGGRKK